ncbi:hypothetical protein F5X68DRAFT_272647 [Plectosphaerella plurivora]|uniref:Uncharacterized protein n=1 Tax=Plectosphaerella plurivora TaxID=936078 RepID=A0A9P9AFE8_9PEZI|nr:hypothetical protein F5X68DRAFT_272647 [Plectosphaerella plurivora]
MSSTITTTLASASATPTGIRADCRNIYEIPTLDASCAMPYGGNHTDIFTKCCGDANVISYYDDCGIYCLAVGQSVGDLTSCLLREGAVDGQVFCGGEVNATATETGGGQAPSTASARVIATGGADSDNDDDNNSGSGSGNGNGGSSNNDNGSGGVVIRPGMSVAGLTVGALLMSALAFGFQM